VCHLARRGEGDLPARLASSPKRAGRQVLKICMVIPVVIAKEFCTQNDCGNLV